MPLADALVRHGVDGGRRGAGGERRGHSGEGPSRVDETWRRLAPKLPFQGRGPNVSEGYELESDVLMGYFSRIFSCKSCITSWKAKFRQNASGNGIPQLSALH